MDTTSWQTPGPPCTATSMPQQPKASNTHRRGHCARTAFMQALRCLAKPSTASQRTAPPPGMPRCTCAQRHAATPSPFSRSLHTRTAKTFPRFTNTPRETQTHPRFSSSLELSLSRRRHPPRKARQGAGPNMRRQTAMGKSIN